MYCTKIKCNPYEHVPKNLEILNFEAPETHFKSTSKFEEVQFDSVRLDHSGSQPFI